MIGYKEHWRGIECEGRYTGLETLFIGDITSSILDGHIPDKPGHIYFCSTATSQLMNGERTWEWFLEWILSCDMIVSLEVDAGELREIPPAIRNKVHIMYMYHDSDFELLKATDSMKVVHDDYQLYCVTKHNMQKVTSDGYTNDQ